MMAEYGKCIMFQMIIVISKLPIENNKKACVIGPSFENRFVKVAISAIATGIQKENWG